MPPWSRSLPGTRRTLSRLNSVDASYRVAVRDASSFEAQCLCSVVGDRAATIATRPPPLRRKTEPRSLRASSFGAEPRLHPGIFWALDDPWQARGAPPRREIVL